LDTNPYLFFHLQQQRLIELIRRGEFAEALEFAAEEMAPRGEENPEFLEELERTMALMAFEDTRQSPVSDLLHPAQRPKLPSLLRMLVWSQNQLDEQRINYPRIDNFGTADLVTRDS
jgi:hypothetical protein